MADDDRRVKRSRFDQTEAEPRRSRFDRRSRSPSARQSESTRTRSPLSREARSPAGDGAAKPAVADPAAAAAAAAAKINAQLQAKKGIQHVDVPPIRSTDSPGTKSENADGSGKDVYVTDGDYIKDIEINDLRNRYTLTKGSTQQMIKDETGADVTTRGNYYPDKNMATAAHPPLYLHVTSTTKEGLEKAIKIIDDLMQKELPNLIDERRFRRREPEQVERDEYGRRKWPDERIPIDLEPIPGFNLRAQVVGQGGAYVKHIQQQTRCRVQIKGRGSGFLESSTGRESDEPMFLHVAGPDANDVQAAKALCIDLLANVKEQYQNFKDNPPQHNYGGYGRGDRYQGGGSGDGGGRGGSGGYGGGGYNRRNDYQQSQHQSPAASASPIGQSAAGAGASATNMADYAAQYAQYYGGTDPKPLQLNSSSHPRQLPLPRQVVKLLLPLLPDPDPLLPPPGGPPGAGGYSAVPPPPGL
ncbi:hypothetical protein N7490_003576 [Penicillium lividum]|nr:hypothetical protein N7490_003576 [Penicillium lividum]